MAVTFTNILVGEGTLSVGTAIGNVVDVGATQDGVEISWEPDMVDIEIDQYGDAARVVQSMTKVSVRTTVAEGTLENLRVSWGYPSSAVAGGVFSVGLHGVYPEEHVIQIVGNAPGSTATVTNSRTYVCNRAIQYSSSGHSLKRSENVAIPLDFRILPDATQTGAEYGTITDVTP